MDTDRILQVLNQHGVRYLMLGGMNFLLRHQPVLTFDLDVWIEPTAENKYACERALCELAAEWGATDETWGNVSELSPGWLGERQSVYCFATPAGALDVFLEVKGLRTWKESDAKSVKIKTSVGSVCRGLSDEDMLACQLALDVAERKQSRVEYLEQKLKST